MHQSVGIVVCPQKWTLVIILASGILRVHDLKEGYCKVTGIMIRANYLHIMQMWTRNFTCWGFISKLHWNVGKTMCLHLFQIWWYCINTREVYKFIFPDHAWLRFVGVCQRAKVKRSFLLYSFYYLPHFHPTHIPMYDSLSKSRVFVIVVLFVFYIFQKWQQLHPNCRF